MSISFDQRYFYKSNNYAMLFFLSFPKYGKQALDFPHLHSNMDLWAKVDLCAEVI